MHGRTEVEKYVRALIALDALYKPLSSLGDKGKRRAEKSAKGIVSLLKEGEEKGERIFARVEKSEEERARTLREGIDEFKKKYKEQGEILEGMIAKKRAQKNKYLVFGLNEGYKLAEEDYLGVMMDLGFDRREGSSVYPHILAISERMGKASEQAERSIIVSRG